MKKIAIILCVLTSFAACKESSTTEKNGTSTPSVSAAKTALDAVQSGGVQLISIETPKGKF